MLVQPSGLETETCTPQLVIALDAALETHECSDALVRWYRDTDTASRVASCFFESSRDRGRRYEGPDNQVQGKGTSRYVWDWHHIHVTR
jgi:hypothetical protein